MVGRSAAMMALQAQIAKVAPTRTRVLITGESGTGKELVARAIHRASAAARQAASSRSTAPPSRNELIESELFGHERGAFTGATARKRGPVRDGRRRDDLPRRDRRHGPVGAGQGAARAAVGRVHARGRRADAEGRRAGRWPPPTGICRRPWPRASSARISTSASTWSRCARRRCASAATTCRCCRRRSSSSPAARTA